MDHDGSDHANDRREDPEDAAHVWHFVGYCCESRTGDHGDSCLRSGHEYGLGLAETVARDDERVEVCDAGVGDGIAECTDPYAVACWVAECLQSLAEFEGLMCC